MKIKVLGSEAACGTSTTNGSNFGSSTAVRPVSYTHLTLPTNREV